MRRATFVLVAAAAVLLTGCAGTPAVAPPSSAAPTAAVRTAPTMTPTAAPIPTQTYTGRGNDVVDLTTPVDVGVLVFDCPTCSGRTAVKSDAGIDEDLVQSLSGAYSGKRWLGMRGGTTSRLQVSADGPWTVTIGGLDLARQYDRTDPVSGTGDDVILFRPAPDTVTLTHQGESNFSVSLMADSFSAPDLIVNEIGGYQGTVLFDVNGTDAGLVEITADGAWTMTPRA